jgi:hypothetical protein
MGHPAGQCFKIQRVTKIVVSNALNFIKLKKSVKSVKIQLIWERNGKILKNRNSIEFIELFAAYQ